MSTADQVLRLRQAVYAAQSGGDTSEKVPRTFTTNRGNKLEPGARFVSSRTLNVPNPAIDGGEYEAEDVAEGRDAAETNASIEIDAARLLQPIGDPSEVSTHPAVKQAFTNKFLECESRYLLDKVVDEKDTMVQIDNLLGAFLGDDGFDVMPQIMANVAEREQYGTPEPGMPLPPVKEDLNMFFALPELKIDRDLGLEHGAAERLRSKLQVAQQRMAEYVRCLTEVRSDLEIAHRLRRDVLSWCREMNNEDYVKVDLDEQNNYDNASLGEQMPKDFYKPQ